MLEIVTVVEFTIKHLIIEDGVVTSTLRICDINSPLDDKAKKRIKEELDRRSKDGY